MKKKSFVEKYVRGEVREKDMLKDIAAWHNSNSSDCLATYLGLTPEEHLAFIEKEENLIPILHNYRAQFLRSQFKLIDCEKLRPKKKSA